MSFPTSTTTLLPGAASPTVRASFPARLTARIAVGGLCWLLTLVFFVGQALAQAATTSPYSLATNEISDLGVTTCGPLRVLTYHATVCSPLHGVMNGAFIATGLLSLLGVIGTYPAWPRRRLATCGLAVLALAGVGEMLAGLAPENVNPGLHVLGALLGLVGANIGLLLLGAAVWHARRWVSLVTVLCGLVGLFGLVIAPSAGMATGTAERLTGYPVVVWMVVVGGFLLWSAARSQARRVSTSASA